MRLPAAMAAAAFVAACTTESAPDSPQDAFWAALESQCGRAFAGSLVESNASDTAFVGRQPVMHVRECSDSVIRVPFHLGENRSRTWVFTRTAAGLRLKHDHRHEDGSEDTVTQYGGDTQVPGTDSLQEFHADAHTAALIPYAAPNIWSFEIVPGGRAAYALRREGRRFRVEFDLTAPVAVPPAPWGFQ